MYGVEAVAQERLHAITRADQFEGREPLEKPGQQHTTLQPCQRGGDAHMRTEPERNVSPASWAGDVEDVGVLEGVRVAVGGVKTHQDALSRV